jgi:hypothetical protein
VLALLALALLAPPADLRAQWFAEPVDEPLPDAAAHYLVGNESRHDVFAAAIADRGGAYLGVGGDQNYTLIAAAGCELAFLLDRDPAIAALHRELGRRIVAAPDAGALLRGLSDPADPPPAALARSWPALVVHLHRVAARRHDGRPTTWLSDPVLYARLRDRWRRGAILIVVGDLAGDLAMPTIAAAAASRGRAFVVVYLSNAEEGLTEPERLAANLRALPRADGAVLLHTSSRPDVPAIDGLWSYEVAPLAEIATGTARG